MYSTFSWSKERSSEAPRPAYGYGTLLGNTRPFCHTPMRIFTAHTCKARHTGEAPPCSSWFKCCLFRVAFSEGQFQTHANSCRNQITDFSLQNPKNQIPLSCLVTTLGSLSTTVWTCSLSSWYPSLAWQIFLFCYLTTFSLRINFPLPVKDNNGFIPIFGEICLWWTTVPSFTLRTELVDTDTIKKN